MSHKLPDSHSKSLFWTPAEVATNLVSYAEDFQKEGLVVGIPSVDRKMLPLRPGWIRAILARPGQGKTSLAVIHAVEEAKRLTKLDLLDKKFVLFWTLDAAVEELAAHIYADKLGVTVSEIAWGKADLDKIRKGALRSISSPIWLMGKSVVSERQIPRQSYEHVYADIARIKKDYGLEPSLVIVDYIQIVPIADKATRSDQVSEAIVQFKQLLLELRCPGVVCVQASRAIDQEQVPLPTIAHCQWSSSLEQEAHQVISLWRPWKTHRHNPPKRTPDGRPALAVKNTEGKEVLLPITSNLFVAELMKQKMEEANFRFYLNFAPEIVRLTELEVERLNE